MTAHWLLELTLDGQVRRYSEDRIEVDDASGETLIYYPGLVSEIEMAPGDAASIEIVDAEVDWPALAPAIERAPVTLRRWTEGTVLEQAIVYALGAASGATYGAREEPVTFAVEPRVVADLPFPDPECVVGAETWPITVSSTHYLADNQIGLLYPRLFGSPGAHPLYTDADQRTPMPVPLAQWKPFQTDTSYVILSDVALNLTSCALRNAKTGWLTAATPAVVTDLLDRRVTIAPLTDSALLPTPGTDDEYGFYAGFESGQGGQFRGAWDVLASLLREFSRSVDWERMYETRDLLNGYQVDTWINAPQDGPWSWFESTLLPYLPVRIVEGASGRYLEHVRRFATASDAVRIVSAQRGDCVRRGGISFLGGDIRNEFTLSYRQDRDGTWLERISCGGTSRPGFSQVQTGALSAVMETQRTVSHPLAQLSYARYGVLAAEPIELDWTWDEATAVRVLMDLVEALAIPQRSVSYLLPYDGDDLRSGDVLLLTDSDVALDDAVAIVDTQPTSTSDGAIVALRLIEVP